MMSPADTAIARMRSPSSQPAPNGMHIICIDVTNRCDLRCSNCTRLLANQAAHWDMTPDNFRLALRSVRGFPGVIAMIGGNPCLHREFDALCRIFVEEISDRRQRGLWSNNILGHQTLVADTFGFFNLNPHGDERGTESLEKLAALIPGLHYYRGQSNHAPLLAAVRDVIPDEAQMWEAISRCDINLHWSGSIVQNNGQLRGYFCEVAASFDLARGEDHGFPVAEGWWRQSIADFSGQVKRFCPGCGIPARLKARPDKDEADDYTVSNADIALRTRGRREVVALGNAERSDRPVTDYTEEHRRSMPVISVVIPCYNAAATLEEAIGSVLAQRAGGRIEIIVADDGSTDGSEAVVRSLRRDEVIFLPAASNTGPAAARNRGLRHARGQFVCFLDADDCYVPGFFDAAMDIFAQHPAAAAIISDIELIDAHRPVHPAQMQAIVFSLPSNMIVRREAAELLGGFPEDAAFRGKSAGEDVAFKQALIAHFTVVHLQHPFLRYRVQRGSHFDLFLDSTEVVGDQIRFLRAQPEDQDGSRPAAVLAYNARAQARLAAMKRAA